ncbi:MAG: class I SAM-dependent methyltransferase [Verrucomicrobia bacterium]|nr:class I SAM-dependent methyltransferase [Verrucomicrobiota bacterium]MBS0646390.1 class I SAM-dependent methyltransferase [Verrucomicrobiota bacterium]
MGIGQGSYKLLLEEKKQGRLKGKSLLQLGRQCVLFDFKTLKSLAKKAGVELQEVKEQLSFDDYYRKKGFIDDHTLFRALGFERVASLDYSDFEGADLVYDLNLPIPKEQWGQFDVVYDGGTAEHVFHFPQFLENVHNLLAEDGIVMHVSPSHNHVDHGFYMFSPQVFSEYYTANHYKILTT